ncbi:MAG: hypothetical protein A2931_00480 [Candidatus Niyogibacteria bacterium RIFCSPLOWO2_01_FULL_45_48]|uniref:DUF6647 domain-containing protein n=2 Tax=Candidatus Niyogiibacteriota TaxID=1817912 RepID=A0A1G2F0T3_9BACT|nr:MAG: hypothetical protein A2931_00480 [Candidatus Niyogibacteria bacterium RIFCSPLOWO2_01_FULL_45_48]OGZ30337.1 MAG: hypothetical protein A2835_01815 [Candidatus Niyogibacteria bacterium RIFCSPHIGHO2_01_FULL_45_28]OGZ31603.1 MAG: hypothetical protein A3J00_00095 [Candidatus Niyogibacteria bacterium RIFCSPLOWO2_02_FULL_45_13]
MEALILSLLVWLGMRTDFNLPKDKSELPKIEYRTAEAMKIIVYGVIGSTIHKEVRASYDKNTLYLPKDFNPKDLKDQRTMLHELVHFLQDYNKRKYECRNVAEIEAYTIATRWGQEYGIEDDYAAIWIFGPRGCFESIVQPDFPH